ncbi:MAG: type II toxin-antitoxin system RelB/DinJ family antitoxin [Bacteroidota bacterium]
MNKTSSISARIDPETKRRAEDVFDQLGLTASQAITLFYRQVELRRGLPFAVELPPQPVPNQATEQALAEADAREQLPHFNTAEALFDDLGI